MRRLVTASLAALLAALVLAAPAAARSSYCSRSGDYCYGLSAERDPVIALTMMARYFKEARICVSPPSGNRTCRTFRVRRYGQVYGVRVRWSSKFPNRGKGTYKVKLYNGDDSLGPSVSFRRR